MFNWLRVRNLHETKSDQLVCFSIFFFNENSPHTIFPRLTFFCTTFPLGLRFADDLPCDWRRRIDFLVIQPFSRNALIRSAWFFHETTEKKKKRKKQTFPAGATPKQSRHFVFFLLCRFEFTRTIHTRFNGAIVMSAAM